LRSESRPAPVERSASGSLGARAGIPRRCSRGYTLFVVGLIEELIFRGALLLAVADGWVALLGSSVAMGLWHVPYYATTLRPPSVVRSSALAAAVSLLFGSAVIATGSLWASVIPHGIGDFLGWFGRHREALLPSPVVPPRDGRRAVSNDSQGGMPPS